MYEYQEFLKELHSEEASVSPALLVADPFGYDLQHDGLQRFFTFPKTEMLITFMVKYIGLAAANYQEESHATNLNALYGSEAWMECVEHWGKYFREGLRPSSSP